MVMFGLISAGVGYNHKISLTHGARESGRYGATLPVTNFSADPDPMASWLDQLATRAIEDATGSLDPGTPGLSICVAYLHPAGTVATDSTRRRLDDGINPASYATSGCFTDGRPATERRVQVLVSRTTQFSVVFYQSTITLSSQAVNRYEAGSGL
jgi:hypothetical protein